MTHVDIVSHWSVERSVEARGTYDLDMEEHGESDGDSVLGVGLAICSSVAVAGVVGVGASGLSAAGPIIAGIVAIVVAMITVLTTNKRQRIALASEDKRLDSRLAAESERQQHQLKAEAGRLREQLSHDRGIADVAELRTLLDDGIRCVRHARTLLANHRRRNAPPGLKEVGAEVGFQSSRLATRIGRTHPTAEALEQVVGQLGTWTQIYLDIDKHLENVGADEIDAALDSAKADFDAALRGFEDAALSLVGVRDGHAVISGSLDGRGRQGSASAMPG